MERHDDVMMGAIPFPCHAKEKFFVYEGAKGRCSAKCPYCSKIAKFDIDEMRSIPMRPVKGALQKRNSQKT